MRQGQCMEGPATSLEVVAILVNIARGSGISMPTAQTCKALKRQLTQNAIDVGERGIILAR